MELRHHLAGAPARCVDRCGTDDPGLPEARDGPDLAALPTVHQEMALLVQHCGFTPLQAIKAATEAGAAALGQSANRGTVTPGKLADLVVLDADPSRDIRNTTHIDFVVKNGHIYTRESETLSAMPHASHASRSCCGEWHKYKYTRWFILG